MGQKEIKIPVPCPGANLYRRGILTIGSEGDFFYFSQANQKYLFFFAIKGTFSGILAQRLPAGKLGNADELADLVEFLTSGKCDWMNGSCIDFDGGEKAVNGSSFNLLSMLSDRQWDEMAKLIRKTK